VGLVLGGSSRRYKFVNSTFQEIECLIFCSASITLCIRWSFLTGLNMTITDDKTLDLCCDIVVIVVTHENTHKGDAFVVLLF